MEQELKNYLEIIIINQEKIMKALNINNDEIKPEDDFWENLKQKYPSFKKWEN